MNVEIGKLAERPLKARKMYVEEQLCSKKKRKAPLEESWSTSKV